MRIDVRVGLGLLALVLVAFLGPLPSGEAAGPAQPVAFSHKIHVQDYRIDCQYCHSEARRSEYAGIPSVSRCMGCHKITAADRPEIKKLHEYFKDQKPIPWVRIFKLPEFVHFPHKPHVRANIQCQTCHGRIEAMERVQAETGRSLVNDLANLAGLAGPSPKLTMGWCLECHTQRKGPLDCMVCHH